MWFLLAACESPAPSQNYDVMFVWEPPRAISPYVDERIPQTAAEAADLFVVYDPALAEEVTEALLLTWDWTGDVDLQLEALAAEDLLAAAEDLLLSAREDVVVHLLIVAVQDEPSALGWVAPIAPVGVSVVAPEGSEVLYDLADRHLGWAGPEVGLGVEHAALRAAGLRASFPLAGRPDLDTLDVEVLLPDGVELSSDRDVDWVWDEPRNAVEFTRYVPDAGAEVIASYLPLERVDEE